MMCMRLFGAICISALAVCDRLLEMVGAPLVATSFVRIIVLATLSLTYRAAHFDSCYSPFGNLTIQYLAYGSTEPISRTIASTKHLHELSQIAVPNRLNSMLRANDTNIHAARLTEIEI